MNNFDNRFIIIFALTFFLYVSVVYYVLAVIYKNKPVLQSQKYSQRKKLRMMYNLIIRSGDISVMSLILLLLTLGTFISLGGIGSIIFNPNIPESYLAFSGAVSLPFTGLCGFIQYTREEEPEGKGPAAKISGVFLMFFGWGLSLVALIYAIIIGLPHP